MAVTVTVPAALNVSVEPLSAAGPVTANVTGSPLLAVAASVTGLPNAAVAGAVNASVCAALATVSAPTTDPK